MVKLTNCSINCCDLHIRFLPVAGCRVVRTKYLYSCMSDCCV